MEDADVAGGFEDDGANFGEFKNVGFAEFGDQIVFGHICFLYIVFEKLSVFHQKDGLVFDYFLKERYFSAADRNHPLNKKKNTKQEQAFFHGGLTGENGRRQGGTDGDRDCKVESGELREAAQADKANVKDQNGVGDHGADHKL